MTAASHLAQPPFLLLAGVFGAAAVALGAFGAHGLKATLGPAGLETWHTAVLYHLIHALALLAVGVGWRVDADVAGTGTLAAPLVLAGWSFVGGILLFSGSLYALALGGPKWLGPVTPVGGLGFIIGWLAIVWAALRAAPAS